MNDIDFGGNDLLQIYNPQQIKHRLNSSGKIKNNYKLNNIITYYYYSIIPFNMIHYLIVNIFYNFFRYVYSVYKTTF